VEKPSPTEGTLVARSDKHSAQQNKRIELHKILIASFKLITLSAWCFLTKIAYTHICSVFIYLLC